MNPRVAAIRARLAFRPRLIDSLVGYRRADFTADLGAGLTVACVALPLAMAFGIASGVKPEQGLITAIVGGFLISLLGGSRVQIGGPAGAFVALLYAIAERHGLSNLLLATMMAGVVLFAMGALRLGQLIRFVPVSIVIGFTNGIAVIIAVSQIRDFLGLPIDRMPANFFSQMAVIGGALERVHWPTVALGLASLALLVVWPKALPQLERRKRNARAGLAPPADVPAGDAATTSMATRATAQGPEAAAPLARRVVARMAVVPAPLVALIAATLAVWLLALDVDTIGSRFGGIPTAVPAPSLPAFDWASAQGLLGPILSIAFLGAVESLLCARIADGMTGERHDPNQELMAQGVANFAAPIFGGVAATGTIARTVTNVRAGARSPIAGMIHAASLLAFMLILAPLASYIPMSVLAAILLHVAWNMGEWRAFRSLRQFSANYRTILLSTFLLTVVFDLTVAVQVGLVMACLFFIFRMASLTRVESLRLPADVSTRPDGRRIVAWRLYGSLFFGSVAKLDGLLRPGEAIADVVILEMNRVINLDTTGLDALETLHRTIVDNGCRLVIAEATEQPLSLMRRSGFVQRLGEANLYDSLDDALASVSA
ncbi:MAG: SulP family inorganic anion transporter [Lautropia sp.]